MVAVTEMTMMMVAVTMVTVTVVTVTLVTLTLVTLALPALPLDALAARSCTWPRARSRRTRGPEPRGLPRHGAAGRAPMTSAAGAGAMAAGAEGEERERERERLRAVTRLQAGARGFLLRRQLRGLREEFEAAVRDIEGHLRHLSWSGSVLQRPCFGLSPGNLLDSEEAAHNEPIPKKTLENPGAEGAGGFGNIPPSSPVPCGVTPNPTNTPNLGAQSLEQEGRAPTGSHECDNDSASAISSPEIPADLRGLSPWELQSHRRHLLMELLWLQQAMASRKHFLMLKQKLGIPNHSGGIPEFLDWCEALRLQHQP